MIVMWFVVAGCRAPVQPDAPTQAACQVADEQGFGVLWASCVDVLRKHRFRIDRSDLRAGVITTMPETSQSVVEFWRRDVATAYDLAESTLHTVRRSAVIHIVPSEDRSEYSVDVTVNRECFDMAERQINNAAGAPRVFSVSMPTTRRRRAKAEEIRWLPDGRDGAMESRLLAKIMARYEQRAG